MAEEEISAEKNPNEISQDNLVINPFGYKCEKCDYTTIRHDLLPKHQAESEDKIYDCDVCAKKLCSEAALRKHKIWGHRSNTKIPTPKLSDSFYKCDKCDYSVQNKEKLQRHQELSLIHI